MTLRSRTLSEIAGCEVFLKFENLQYTASFKERGALNRLLSLPAEARTRGNGGLKLVLAIAYGGRWDIAAAVRTLARAAREGRVDPESIDESMVGAALSLGDLPDPDLFIRTGGEHRISNFLLWNLAYTELWFTDLLWPEFGVAELTEACGAFAERERRFGKTSEQLGGGAC